jgi:hypothetical protein
MDMGAFAQFGGWFSQQWQAARIAFFYGKLLLRTIAAL